MSEKQHLLVILAMKLVDLWIFIDEVGILVGIDPVEVLECQGRLIQSMIKARLLPTISDRRARLASFYLQQASICKIMQKKG
jgi:hypothetical protein